MSAAATTQQPASAGSADFATRYVVLTRRQNEVLYWLSRGRQLTDVSDVLGGISYSTIKTIARTLYRRLNVRTAAEAVRVGFEVGLLTPRLTDPPTVGVVADRRRVTAPPDVHAAAAAAALRSRRTVGDDDLEDEVDDG